MSETKFWKLRDESGKSLKEFAPEIYGKDGKPVNYQLLQKYESGTIQQFPLYIIKQYRDIFGVSSDYLLGFSEDKKEKPDNIAISSKLGLSQDAIERIKELRDSNDPINYVAILNDILELPIDQCETLLDEINSFVSNKFNTPAHAQPDKEGNFIPLDEPERSYIHLTDDTKELLKATPINQELLDTISLNRIGSLLKKIRGYYSYSWTDHRRKRTHDN